jgi:hypothetical protein
LIAKLRTCFAYKRLKFQTDLVEDLSFEAYPYVYWNCAEKKGYS